MREFDETQTVFGIIKIAQEQLGKARFQLHYNRIDTSEMHSDVFALDSGIVKKLFQLPVANEVIVEGTEQQSRISFRGTLTERHLGGGSDKVGTIEVENFVEETHIHPNPIKRCYFNFYLTEMRMFRLTAAPPRWDPI